MVIKLLCSCVLLLCLRLSLGCHSVNHFVDPQPRQGGLDNINVIDAENTDVLRQYFTNCLRGRVGDIWEWKSVVDTSILDTSWYETTGNSICSGENNNDTPECWISRLNEYTKNTSFLFDPIINCINEYTGNTAQGTARFSSVIFESAIENSNVAPELCQIPSQEPYQPNSRSNREYALCNQEETQFPPDRPFLNYPSVFQFVQDHTICSSELPGCDNFNEETAIQGDADVPRWPYRFEALVKQSSPLSSAIRLCNERVFPLQSDWQPWSECSVTCGEGTRTRNRNECSEPGCPTSESQSCSEDTCPKCMISMFSRRVCGGAGITSQDCLSMGCCFSEGSCYMARREDPSGSDNDPCGDSMDMNFRPSRAPTGILAPFGSILLTGGSKLRMECSASRNAGPCTVGFGDCSTCSRMGCCWIPSRRRCYTPIVIVDELEEECDPGFENPPACTPINPCTSMPCNFTNSMCIPLQNGSFKCSCLPGYVPTIPFTCVDGCTLDSISFPSNAMGIGSLPQDGVLVGSTITLFCPDLSPITSACIGRDTWTFPVLTCH